MNKTKMIAVLAIIAMVMTMFPISLFAVSTNDRIYGEGRVQTALEIANTGWTTSSTVILAPADQNNLVDALAAAALAGQENAPILLTFKNTLDPAVKAKIKALGVNKVYVIGAVSSTVAAEVDAIENVTIEVLKGNDRWATAKVINEQLTDPAGTFVIGYNAIPDALSVASYAAKNKYAIVLAAPDGRLPSGQSTFGSSVYIIGGPTLVANINDATRIFGANRFETNRKIAEQLTFSYSKVYVANGVTGLVDALSVAPLAAKSEAFVALSDGSNVAAAAVLNNKINTSTQVVALGGPNVVSDSTKGKITVGTSVFKIESVKALSSSQLEIKFNKAVNEDSLIDDNSLVPDVEINRVPVDNGVKDVNADTMYAELSTDGLTLTLGADTYDDEYFDGTYSIYIPDGVTSKTGYESLGSYSTQITVDDKTAPTVKNIAYNSTTDQIEVLMSEICDIDPTITVDNGSGISATVDGMGTKYSFDNDWDRGDTVTVRVHGAVDYKGNVQEDTYTQDITLTMNETPLDITSITQSGSNGLKLIFNKVIAPSGSSAGDESIRENDIMNALSVTRSGVTISVSSVDTDSSDSSKRTYKVILEDGNGPEYARIYNDKASATINVFIDDNELTDVYGGTNEEIFKTVTMTKDSSAPELVSIGLSSNKERIIALFNENVNLVDSDYLTIRKDGIDFTDEFAITVGSPSAKEITFNYSDEIPNGTYTIRIEEDAIADDFGNNNEFQSKSITVTGGESTVKVSSITDYATNEYRVDFDDMVNNTALQLSSYTLNGVALPTGTDIYFENNNKTAVIIQLPPESVNYNSTSAILRVVSVQDTLGHTINSDRDEVTVVDNVGPTLLSATITGNILTLSFDENMAENLDTLAELASDLEIKGGATQFNPGNGLVTAYAEGKKVYITISNVGTSNWNTIKAYTNISIKTLSDSTYIGDEQTGAIQNSLKKDVTVNVVKL